MMKSMIYIYSLIDPFTNKIRYIGKSTRPKERLRNHCNEKANSWRNHWIRSVISKGGQPQLSILETLADDADWQSIEIGWIKRGRDAGWPLTNCTDGGDGVTNLCGESKERMLRTWKGRKHKPETLIKLSISSKGRRKTDDAKKAMSVKMKGRKITWTDKISKANKKLNESQIMEVRQLLKDKVSQYTIADMFGVHQGTISNIKRGKFY
jgi:hypothetical protein